MIGILRIAYKLLVNDKANFAVLIIWIAFAVFSYILVEPKSKYDIFTHKIGLSLYLFLHN